MNEPLEGAGPTGSQSVPGQAESCPPGPTLVSGWVRRWLQEQAVQGAFPNAGLFTTAFIVKPLLFLQQLQSPGLTAAGPLLPAVLQPAAVSRFAGEIVNRFASFSKLPESKPLKVRMAPGTELLLANNTRLAEPEALSPESGEHPTLSFRQMMAKVTQAAGSPAVSTATKLPDAGERQEAQPEASGRADGIPADKPRLLRRPSFAQIQEFDSVRQPVAAPATQPDEKEVVRRREVRSAPTSGGTESGSDSLGPEEPRSSEIDRFRLASSQSEPVVEQRPSGTRPHRPGEQLRPTSAERVASIRGRPIAEKQAPGMQESLPGRPGSQPEAAAKAGPAEPDRFDQADALPGERSTLSGAAQKQDLALRPASVGTSQPLLLPTSQAGKDFSLAGKPARVEEEIFRGKGRPEWPPIERRMGTDDLSVSGLEQEKNIDSVPERPSRPPDAAEQNLSDQMPRYPARRYQKSSILPHIPSTGEIAEEKKPVAQKQLPQPDRLSPGSSLELASRIDRWQPPVTAEQVIRSLTSQGWRFKRKAGAGPAGSEAMEERAAQLEQATDPGAPLPTGPRSVIETALGRDFSRVRLHSNLQLSPLHVQAATKGRDLYVEPGQDRFDTPASMALLGHELTHVVQQGFAGPRVQMATLPQSRPANTLKADEAEAAYNEQAVLDLFHRSAVGQEGEDEGPVRTALRSGSARAEAVQEQVDDLPFLPPHWPVPAETTDTEPAEEESTVESLLQAVLESEALLEKQKPNLKQLARKVYPFLKRRLALERRQMPT